MRLTLTNSKYAVVQWAMWNGGVVSCHNSLSQAIKKAQSYNKNPNANGYEVCRVFPITLEANTFLQEVFTPEERFYLPVSTKLVSDLPHYDGSQKYNEYCL